LPAFSAQSSRRRPEPLWACGPWRSVAHSGTPPGR